MRCAMRWLIAGALALSLAGCGTDAGTVVGVEDSFDRVDLVAEVAEDPDLYLVDNAVEELTPEVWGEVSDVGPTDLEGDYGPGPGEAGYPCISGNDCTEGFCVQTGDGMQCTISCLEECPFDWECVLFTPSLPDQVFICMPRLVDVCRPCEANTDCWTNGVDAGQACVQYGASGNFCGGSCVGPDDCPSGHLCLASTDVTGDESKQCVLADGECKCKQWFADAGALTDCYDENEWGRCYGQRQCLAGGLTDCDALTPAADSCNGKDDDCDGEVDEETSGEACWVINSFGACPGEETCSDGKLECVGAEPHKEKCDGEDNDCDGAIDEDFIDTDGDGLADCLESDIDGDGIVDGLDNCPSISNPAQEDFDVDNFGDVCDADDDNDMTGDDDDCAPKDPETNPAAEEICDGKDNNCNYVVDEGFIDSDTDGFKDCIDDDDDNDGVGDSGDCAPTDPDRFPGSPELCDGLDNDCDSEVDEIFPDSDDDGVPDCADDDDDNDGTPDGQDCAPLDPDLHTAADEVCDGLDNDCNGLVDEGFKDSDGDLLKDCVDLDDDNDDTPDDQDCAPQVPEVFPGAPEVCDGQDNDCNEEVDDGLGTMACGKGECFHTIEACIDGVAQSCDPLAGVALEICDAEDNDCDGLIDEDLGSANCGLGICSHTVSLCVEGVSQECDPLAGSVAEACDGLDNNCNGKTDEGFPELACGKGKCFHTVDSCVGGEEKDCNPFEGASPEVCDGIDNDCDGDKDEDLGTVACGEGICAHESVYCVAGKVAICNPFLGVQEEVCDGVDNDCNGLVDESLGKLTCGKGECAQTVPLCLNGEEQECDPQAGAEDETCDGLDNDCDGLTDEGLGLTTCGAGQCQHTVNNCEDGVPQECNPNEGLTPEICDGVDNDCDGNTDEDFDDTDSDGEADCIDSDDDGDGDADLVDCAPLNAAISHFANETCFNNVDDDCDEAVDEDCSLTSCKAINDDYPATESGLFTIDPDGNGGDDPFQVWCDMDTDGGGWTLISSTGSKGGVNSYQHFGRTAIKHYGNPYTDVQTGNSPSFGLGSNAGSSDKVAYFELDTTFSFTELRGSWRGYGTSSTHHDDNWNPGSWGQHGAGSSGYVMFGTPGKIIKSGGQWGGDWNYTNKTKTLTFDTTVPSGNIIRWGVEDQSTTEYVFFNNLDIYVR
jgi:hypothetical protein